jgi:hypothetical protein
MQREGVAGDVDEGFSSGDELEKCRKEYGSRTSLESTADAETSGAWV